MIFLFATELFILVEARVCTIAQVIETLVLCLTSSHPPSTDVNPVPHSDLCHQPCQKVTKFSRYLSLIANRPPHVSLASFRPLTVEFLSMSCAFSRQPKSAYPRSLLLMQDV
jgi:hypothetical protein